jgi:hypothetical protein
VNRQFAAKIFGSTEAVGRYYKLRDGTRIQVVGIVEDGKYFNLTEDPEPAMFFPILQSPSNETWLVVRSKRDSGQLALALKGALHDLDPGLPAYISTWNKELEFALFPARVATFSLGVLGLMGAMLSLTGIFGMAAYSVSKRLKELGIRMALGAQRKEVLHAALGNAPRNLSDQGPGGHRVSCNSPRSTGIGWRCISDVVVGAAGYVDSRATRAVARSIDTTARGMTWASSKTRISGLLNLRAKTFPRTRLVSD